MKVLVALISNSDGGVEKRRASLLSALYRVLIAPDINPSSNVILLLQQKFVIRANDFNYVKENYARLKFLILSAAEKVYISADVKAPAIELSERGVVSREYNPPLRQSQSRGFDAAQM
jgi:hypothetical protein